MTQPEEKTFEPELVGICICITSHSYYLAHLVLETLQDKTGIHSRLYIAYQQTEDNPKITEYLNELKETGAYVEVYGPDKTYIQMMNHLMSLIYQKYTCIFPGNTLVHNLWLENLIAEQHNVENTGVSGLRKANSFSKHYHLQPLLKKDADEPDIYAYNFQSTMNVCDGVCLFETEKGRNIKYFHEGLQNENIAMIEFCIRLSLEGYTNYFVIENSTHEIAQSILPMPWEHMTMEGMIEFKNHVQLLVKNKYNIVL